MSDEPHVEQPQGAASEDSELSVEQLDDVSGGNIVQTFPAPEYDFVPNRLVPPKPAKQDD